MSREAGKGEKSPVEVSLRELGRSALRPRLLYIITRSERGGAQSHVLEVAQGMRDYFDVHVATGAEGFLTEACRSLSIPVHLIPHLRREVNPFMDLPAWFETLQLLRTLRPDLIHAHTWKSGFIGRSAAMALGIPAIYTVHMWPFGPSLPFIWQMFGPPIERVLARCSRRLIAVSQSAAETALKYRIAPASRIVAIENGIQDCKERAELCSRAVPTLAMVARFSELKDHQTLLKAFAAVELPARLQLIGDGPTRSANEKLARTLGIENRVEFLGERSDIAAILTKVDLFVLASKTELLPISIIEAMRAGLPVIASNVGGVAQLTIDGQTGFLVEPSSVAELSNALTRLLANSDLRIRMGRSGRLRYEERFNSRAMCASTLSVYQSVLAENDQAKTEESAVN